MRKPLSFLGALLLAASLTVNPGNAGAALPDFTELAQDSGPAVVNINTEKTAKSNGSEEFFGEMFRNLPPGFERFFEPFNRGQQGKGNRPAPKQKSLGSGFIISKDGYIVTNYHVVDGADVIRVTLDEKTGKGASVTATLVGSDEETDLALLKIDVKEDLPYFKFGDSDKLKVGEWVLAIGNPFGLDHSVTAGILSAKGRRINAGAFDNFLQTDASINPGNSGGPL
ncbi:MAG: trypsin-like peptidase domain-containing protein, partial [Desulfovibrionaceae bacterium]|nr:trypsin-like peptidase domain-containing protein [Desulfovibrionaceae bacterium]